MPPTFARCPVGGGRAVCRVRPDRTVSDDLQKVGEGCRPTGSYRCCRRPYEPTRALPVSAGNYCSSFSLKRLRSSAEMKGAGTACTVASPPSKSSTVRQWPSSAGRSAPKYDDERGVIQG